MNNFKLTYYILFLAILFVAAPSTIHAQCQDVSGFKVDNWNSYNIVWNSDGSGKICMTKYSNDIAFKADWSGGVDNVIARRGKKYNGSQKHSDVGTFSASYAANFNPKNNGNAYMGVYGWTTGSKVVEFYIMDNYGEYEPGLSPISEKDQPFNYKGTYWFDGGYYNIYTTLRDGKKDINGNISTFDQYLSVRNNPRTSGTVSISDHFKQWESLGMKMGEINEVTMAVEAFKSEGSAEFYNASITVTNNSNNGNSELSGVYRLKNNWGQQYLTAGGSDSWSPIYNAYLRNSWGSQKWRLECVSPGVYTLRCAWGGRYLNGDGSSPWKDTNTAPYNSSWYSQRWALEHVYSNVYRLKCLWGNYYLNGGNTEWTGVPTSPLNPNWYSQLWSLEWVGNWKEETEGLGFTSDISVYPNPAQNKINLSGISGDNINISITDMKGRVIKTDIITESNTIDIEDLPSGLYTIRAEYEGAVGITKFIKN